jgi:hypothetical protein
MNQDPVIGTMTFSEIQKLPDNEKIAYLESVRASQSDKVIESAPPHKQLALRAMQARYMARMRKIKNRYIRAEMAFFLMRDSFLELKQKLNELKEKEDGST